MRFNPPPNWPPVPPGWTPPSSWQPDPSWPPPPSDWPLWVADTAPRRKVALILGGLAAVLLIGVGALIAVVATRETPGVIATPSTTTVAPASDEEKVRDVVDRFQQTWNDADYDAMTDLFCADMRADSDFSEDLLREQVETAGPLDLDVISVDVDGRRATANVTNAGEDPDDIAFVLESGDWKWCDY